MNIVEVLIRTKEMGMEAAGGKAELLSSRLRKVGMVGALALGAVGVESVRMAAKFDASMTLLETQAGVGHRKMEFLKQGIIDLAGKVGFDPDSLAQSAFHVASNLESMGASGSKMLAIIKTAAEGARVGQADLVDVTNALGAAIASKIPGVENFSQAMGALNAIVGTGDMHMQDLAEAFGSGMLAVVKGYGLSLKDVGAVLATFGDNNIRGAHAATMLRMAVQSLAVPAADGKKILDGWGLSANTFAKDMQHGGLLPALEHLQSLMRMHGIGQKEQGDILTQMFGKRAGAGLAVIMDQLDRLKSKYPELTKGAGDFGKAWGKTQGTLQQQLHELNGGFQALMVTIGEKLIPVVMSVVTWMNKHKGATQVILAMAAAFGVLTVAVAALNVVIDANPISLIVIALFALGAALLYAWHKSLGFREAVTTVFKDIAVGILNYIQVSLNAVQVLVDAVLSQFGIIVHAAAAAFGWIPGIGPKIKAAASKFDDFASSVKAAFAKANGTLQNWKDNLEKLPKIVKIQGNIDDLTKKLDNAKQQLKDPNLTKTRRAQIEANIARLQSALATARAQLAALQGYTVTTFVVTQHSTVYSPNNPLLHRATGGIIGAAASGGSRSGLTWVGEQGPELVRLPTGSMVYPHGQPPIVPGGGGEESRVVIELRGSGRLEHAIIDAIKGHVRTAGGGDVQVAFGS